MNAKITLTGPLSPIDDRLYSSFIEHMGRAVYTGIYEPGHPSADEAGFRQDVKELIRPLGVSQVRYPGGNFLSGYDWKDGIGPKSKRPQKLDMAWSAIEPNQVGTDEFLAWCESLGISPMLGVNLGTGTPKDAVELLEYVNGSQDTYWANRRRENGRQEPYHVKLWCLGNEMDGPWQICAKTAQEYGRIAAETGKFMKMLDPDIELVACGSSFRDMPTYGAWEETVLRNCYPYIDYLSLHQYYTNNEEDVPSFLARSEEMGEFIEEVSAICEKVRLEQHSEKKIYLSFDEWNVWYHFQKAGKEPPKWTVARPIEEELYDHADTLLVGSMLCTLLNHADTVKIACLAQLVNVIAPIMTAPGGRSWTQTIYWPFLYTSRYGKGTALKLKVDCPTYDCALRKNVPILSCAAVLSPEGDYITLFAINKDPAVSVTLSGIDGTLTQHITLTAPSFDTVNTQENQPVVPREAAADGTPVLPAASWNMLRFLTKKQGFYKSSVDN